MDNKTLERLFLNKLNSFSKKELRERLNDVPATGLGDLIHEDEVYSRLENSAMNLSSPIHRVKNTYQHNYSGYNCNSTLLNCANTFEQELAA